MSAELYMPHDDDVGLKLSKEMIRCVNFAAIKHKDQRRKDEQQTPYVNHVIGVAYLLVSEGGVSDISVLQAALLHDTVEDTDTTFYELQAEFGEDIANLVKEVTDDKSLPKPDRKRLQIEHAAQSSHRAKLIKLADKLYNLRDLRRSTPVGWTSERVQEYFEWAAQVVAGLRGTNKVMEQSLDKLFEERGLNMY
uniref:Guanosine-3',5'-bis(diphosphate) 3'-pyrophosphohydrolase MESH1 n=1 Tax=Arion vulgaris TaxID=1028688 RepID=A0A0B6ZFF8_9EUPU